jgi:formylmethanofuran dehydrogenase subunit B
LSKRFFDNVVCTFCGCCCDDLQVELEGNKIVNVKNACTIAANKFLTHESNRILSPLVRKKDKLVKASFEEAVDKAARILSKANYPLLYGWSSTSCEAIRVGVELAEALGGVIDNTTTTCHGPSILGAHEIGESTSSLGEIRHRADLIIYWGCNPVHAHPRHMTRYTSFSKGRFRKSRKERKLIVVDVRKTDTAKVADEFIQVVPNQDYELLLALRMAIKGEEIEQESVAGVPVDKIEELADEMIGCEYGALFFGLGLTMSSGKHRNIDAALSLVRDLNTRTKFVIMPMRGWFNVRGANEVLTWQTGYPFAVDFSHGYPRYNPGETSAVDILAREECDSALIVASDPLSNLPFVVAKHLTKIPIVTIDPCFTLTSSISDVVIPSAFVGIEEQGSIYRMDGVVLEAKKLKDPPAKVKSDVEILKAILKRVKKIKGES